MEIITYPHPTLRYKAKPLKRVNSDLKAIVAEMFHLMYEHRGVGLAATQVDLPIRLFVANPAGAREEGDELVFINPIVSRGKGNEEDVEGCLSLPGVHGKVKRNKSIRVSAYDLEGNEIDQAFDGFLARIIQHETDHLNGVLFIDRLVEGSEKTLEPQLSTFVTDFQSRQRTGSLPDDQTILARLAEWEAKFC